MAHPISDAWFHRLKSATRDLVTMAGGVVRTGEVASASKSEVSRWQSPSDTALIPLASVLALEAEVGIPLVTAVMADLQGRRLSDPEAEGRSVQSLVAGHAALMRESGEVMASMAGALADGKVTPAEAEIVDRTIASLETAAGALRRDIAELKAGSPSAAALRAVK